MSGRCQTRCQADVSRDVRNMSCRCHWGARDVWHISGRCQANVSIVTNLLGDTECMVMRHVSGESNLLDNTFKANTILQQSVSVKEGIVKLNTTYDTLWDIDHAPAPFDNFFKEPVFNNKGYSGYSIWILQCRNKWIISKMANKCNFVTFK